MLALQSTQATELRLRELKKPEVNLSLIEPCPNNVNVRNSTPSTDILAHQVLSTPSVPPGLPKYIPNPLTPPSSTIVSMMPATDPSRAPPLSTSSRQQMMTTESYTSPCQFPSPSPELRDVPSVAPCGSPPPPHLDSTTEFPPLSPPSNCRFSNISLGQFHSTPNQNVVNSTFLDNRM
ncbi:uncharacterized protein LOC128982520 [Macrosteles quadrilineatus]|uniref:uncharacterized protein LOC128982460 n=1 Tax=Macrosteles quadrilineatus TaxID=74068 RepID=UPI0023E19B0A|nr:uncharacterized protein LOC128982460 [Macrosteles quadrilineatus]XP_054257420.1 uncharacterized protein LOC128982484 [Macrosteles quadrilineatus]XP_054257454.1 uncharacterized protein LOC128982520 [Macrosteles quadrilineatus]